MLGRCIDSFLKASEKIEANIVVVDNNSQDGTVNWLGDNYGDIKVIKKKKNAGFAAAVNEGLNSIDAPYVLMLNTDAVLTGDALVSMLDTLRNTGKSCAGVAPKMMLSDAGGVIDSVGTVMPPTGASFSRGIGQCDLGQYDTSEEVSGVCFGAALLRRELFEGASIGRLHEGYFLYFEDADWCMRAMSQGYHFLSVPGAVVVHEHSGITRQESTGYKYRLIELNTLKIVTRTFDSPVLASRVVIGRLARLAARTVVRRQRISENISIAGSYLAELPSLLLQRRRLKARRIVPDDRVFRMAKGENSWFDTVSYQPDRCLDSLIDTYQRLDRLSDGERYGKLLMVLGRLKKEEQLGHRPRLNQADADLFAGEPACVNQLLMKSVRSV